MSHDVLWRPQGEMPLRLSRLARTVAASLNELARIGGGVDGGVTRLAWSPELFEAYRWVAERMCAVGLDVEIDAAGNLIGCWQTGDEAPVAVGSHLDTVPTGGRFDGALGVIAGVHAVALLKQEGFQPERPLWIIAFMDEEGTRFNAALFGSRAFAGEDLTDLGLRVDRDGVTLRQAMAAAAYDLDRVHEARRVEELAAYFELHIEQGPVLDSADVDVGVVTSIVGLRGYRVRLTGEANHAGTTPMRHRRDAFLGAARIALELREAAGSRSEATANVGKIALEPGGANVVPGVADFTIDVRSPTVSGLAELEAIVDEAVARVAREEGLDVQLEQTFALEPLELDAELLDLLDRAAEDEGVTAIRMPSGAGHDAMIVGRHVPAAMLFVPSRAGISHSPKEYSSPEQVEVGMRVLASALRYALRAA